MEPSHLGQMQGCLVLLYPSSHLPPLWHTTQLSHQSGSWCQDGRPCLRLDRERWTLSTLPFSAACCAVVRPEAQASSCTLELAFASAFPSPLCRLLAVWPPSMPFGKISQQLSCSFVFCPFKYPKSCSRHAIRLATNKLKLCEPSPCLALLAEFPPALHPLFCPQWSPPPRSWELVKAPIHLAVVHFGLSTLPSSYILWVVTIRSWWEEPHCPSRAQETAVDRGVWCAACSWWSWGSVVLPYPC